MAQAARAYRLDAYPDVVEERFSSSDVRAVRTGAAPVGKPQTTPIVVIGRAAAVLLVVVAVLCFARIALTNAAVTTMIESDAISAEIGKARSTGVSLEMEQSLLASTPAIKSAVKRLNMAAPAQVGTIALDADVVALDGNGDLSLSDTIKNTVSIQE
jgi:hypothetical protein